jgi:(1->4)-alpha-D-glucan 1-alpha-D-glucosylmutase
VVVEKIAAGHERVPENWAVHGTTGYRFAAVVDGLFVDADARARIDRIWRVFTGESADFGEMAYQGKRMIMRSALASELTVLATELLRIARADRRTRDYTFNTLRRALEEVAACMPVYRTYITGRPSAQDRRYVDWAVARATRRSRAADTTIFAFVRQTLLARAVSGAPPELVARVRRFAMRFQQFTSPVTAKGVEDTACYLFNRLVSLNDVGFDPEAFGMSVSAFHGASADRAQTWPHTMLAGSTHDNKRSEDVRQRINAISEMPAAWRLLLRRWRMLNRSKRRTVGGEPAPSRNDEYLLYQTLLGTLPDGVVDGEALQAYRSRIEDYMLKAAREAKQRTSWISPDERYEGRLREFVGELLADTPNNAFLPDLREQAAFFRWFGALNSLGATILRFSSPGLPDLYQGDELFDFSLVDPDNRRAVDYGLRARLLEEIEAQVAAVGAPETARTLGQDPCDPRTKLFVIRRLLAMRSRLPELLRDGDYRPLEVVGSRSRHAVAFARRSGEALMIVVVGRLFAGLLGAGGRLPVGDAWEDTQLRLGESVGARAEFTDALTGARLRVAGEGLKLAEVLQYLPGAVLVSEH